MALKYNFTLPTDQSFLVTVLTFANDAVSGLLVYTILIFAWGLLLWRYSRTTLDFELEMIRSLFATNILGILLYYGGIKAGSIYISSTVLLLTIIINIIGAAYLYYQRTNDDL